MPGAEGEDKWANLTGLQLPESQPRQAGQHCANVSMRVEWNWRFCGIVKEAMTRS